METAVPTRACSKCHKVYELNNDNFFRHSQRKDGFHSWCKPCCKAGNQRSLEKKYSTFEGRITTFLRTCKNSSKKRGHEFNLTRQDFIDMWEAQEGLCAYSGIKLNLAPNTTTSVSVERIDNTIGYTPENTVLVAKAINSMKSNLTGEEFYDFCKSVVLWLSNENLERQVDFKKI